MKEITSAINARLSISIWVPMSKLISDNIKPRSSVKFQLEREIHDKLESRLKFRVMIPIEWRLNTDFANRF